MEQKVVVEVFGEKFSLKTDQDPEYLQKLAALVDKEMRAVSRQVNNLAPVRVGVLAALKLADEYFQIKKDFDEMADLVRKNK